VHQPLLQQAVRERLAGIEVRLLSHAPALGAVHLAAALPRPELEIM
jgi:glucosamine kinase